MKLKLSEVAFSLLIIFISASFSNQQHIPIKWPEIENESVVDEYQAIIVALANTKLNVTALPKVAQEDGRDIMNDLHEGLNDCRNKLSTDHVLWQYKVCIHQQLDTTENHIWDLINSLPTGDTNSFEDDDDSASVQKAISVTLMSVLLTISLVLRNLV